METIPSSDREGRSWTRNGVQIRYFAIFSVTILTKASSPLCQSDEIHRIEHILKYITIFFFSIFFYDDHDILLRQARRALSSPTRRFSDCIDALLWIFIIFIFVLDFNVLNARQSLILTFVMRTTVLIFFVVIIPIVQCNFVTKKKKFYIPYLSFLSCSHLLRGSCHYLT